MNMKRQFRAVYVISLACFGFCFSQAATDTALRTDLNLSLSLGHKLSHQSYIFAQINDRVSDFDYFELGTGLQYRPGAEWFSFAACYQQSYSREAGGGWALEQRPSLNLNLKQKALSFVLSDQIRYEYRIKPEWHDYRIKNTLTASHPRALLKPQAVWEMFYENRNKEVILHRMKLAMSVDFKPSMAAGPYYRFDYSKTGFRWDWIRQVIGFQITLKK